MRFLFNLIQMLFNQPWWVSLAVIAGLIALVFVAGWYIRRQFDKIVTETVLSLGAVFKDAAVTVHSVSAAPVPAGPSPYDLDKSDENYMEGLDGEPWDDEDANFYWIDATISPADPHAKWDPTVLALVPADFAPEDPTEISERLCALHSAERFVHGRFQPAPEEEVRGPQRLRMLFAIGDGLREVKFASGVTYFGHVKLPAPLPKGSKLVGKH